MLKFFKTLFLPKASKFSVHIDGTQDEVFKGIQNISNWYLFDFHDLIYLYNEKIMDTKYGRCILLMRCDERSRQVRYSIESTNEGKWNFEINVNANANGSVLNLKCWAPRRILRQTFHLRTSDLNRQLERFKTLVEARRI